MHCSENSSHNPANAPILHAKDSNDSLSPRGSLIVGDNNGGSSPAHRSLVAKDSNDSLSNPRGSLVQGATTSRRSSVEDGPQSRGASPAPESETNSRRSSVTADGQTDNVRPSPSPTEGLIAVLKQDSPQASPIDQGPRRSITASKQSSNQPERGSLSPLVHARSSTSSAAPRPSTTVVDGVTIDKRLVELAQQQKSKRNSSARASTTARSGRTLVASGRRRSSGDDYGDGEDNRPIIDRDAMPRISGTVRAAYLNCTDRCCMRDEDNPCTTYAELCLGAIALAAIAAAVIHYLIPGYSYTPIPYNNTTDLNSTQALEFYAPAQLAMPVLHNNATIAYRVCNATTPNQRKRSLKALKKMLGRPTAKQVQRNSNAHNRHFNNNSRKK